MISSPDTPSSSEIDLNQEPAREERPALKEFLEKLNSFPTPEEKISYGLSFMREAISQEGSPRFREFWEGRKELLPLFKENLNPAIRSNLWNEYIELTVEARRLKEILEEQSAFAIEQIDLAIQAIEGDLSSLKTILQSAPSIEFPEECQTLQNKKSVYEEIQKELNLLNALASRLSALRKEIMRTDMRIRFKTKFFKRLSDLGDRVFPRRKELIEKVSEEFEKDVSDFVQHYFKGESVVGAPYFAIREEIKTLQSMAKVFTLSSGVFSRTRLKLSECWDQIRSLTKEHKKEALEKRQASFEKRSEIQEKIDLLKGKASELSVEEINHASDEILQEMRVAFLQREDVKYLKDALFEIKRPHIEAQEKEANRILEVEREKVRIRKEKLSSLRESIQTHLQNGSSMGLEELSQAMQEIEEQGASLGLSKLEKQQMDRSLRPLKDLIAEKKELSLLDLSDDEKKTLENLKAVLVQRKKRRQEVKEQLEVYRKALGGSNLDFEKAMHYQDLVEQEKERLDKASSSVEEIEEKIREVEGS